MSDSSLLRIVWLHAPEAAEPELVGGKCRSLAALAAAGLPVPPGFVVSTLAYREAISAMGLDGEIEAALSAGDLSAPEIADAAAGRIEGLIRGQSLPTPLTAEISRAYRTLSEACGATGGVAVAVRSSATAEDLAAASFAGQQDTVLNIAGAEKVVRAVRNCWASLYSSRAIAYRARHAGWGSRPLAMAVGVQVLVPARAAGVLFTVNPQTGDPSQIIIEASWGLGEAVVSGLVTPDRYVLEKQTYRTTEMVVAQKTMQVVRGPTGTVQEAVPPPQQGLPCLTLADREQLAALAGRVEEIFGPAQDIEWAIDASGRCFLLQARPVTTRPRGEPSALPPPPAGYGDLYRSLIWNGPAPGTAG